MTGSLEYTSQRTIACCICSGPIPLETTKTDERGRAVHEECYVHKTISRSKTVNSIRFAEILLSSIVARFQFRPRAADNF